MGASDRFLFSAGTIGSTSRVLAESTPGSQPTRPANPPRSSTVLQRCGGPVQLSLFAGLDALPRGDECESQEPKALMIERRLGGRRSTD
jgi:hypothetical protein